MNTILKSQPNFRDLGGISTKCGKKIKENKIFRSAFVGPMNESDLSILKNLNIEKVIDLRTSKEVELIGKASFPDYIDYENIALNAGDIAKTLIPIFEKGEFHLIEPNILEKFYFDLISKFKTELASIFRKIINTNQGIVYHCSHGKDRTGIISALLLDVLEVDRHDIYEDYLKSNTFLKKQNDYQLQLIKDHFNAQFKREISTEEFAPIKALFYCHKDILKGVFEYIDTTYGSVNNYFLNELGITSEELKLLKLKYLE